MMLTSEACWTMVGRAVMMWLGALLALGAMLCLYSCAAVGKRADLIQVTVDAAYTANGGEAGESLP